MDIRRSEIDDIKKKELDMKKKIAAIAAFLEFGKERLL